MKIKICGITNKQDALDAVSLGADAVGFIFYPQSPRYVDPNIVEEIAVFLPPFIHRVGVFVDADRAYIESICDQCKLNVVQLHGDETPADCMGFRMPTVKCLRVSEITDLDLIPQYQGRVSAILLDTKVQDIKGGTGKTFDWGLAVKAKEYDIPIILSGGVSEDNVNKAMALVQPYAIDLSSSIEKEPGLKDYHKMDTIIQLVRSF